MKALNSQEKQARAWYSYRRIALLRNRGKRSETEVNRDQLPSIASATLTGIRTFIQGNLYSKESSVDLMNLKDGTTEVEHHVKGTQKILSESDAESFAAKNSF